MPQGDKSAYTDKQKRQAEHIEKSYEERGVSEKEAEKRAWATVNKQDGGGKKSGSGRAPSRKNGEAAKTRSHAERSEAAKKGWETRRKRRRANKKAG